MNDYQEQNSQPKSARHYLHMASATEESIDAFIDALLEEAEHTNRGQVDPDAFVRKMLQDEGIEPSQLTHFWYQKAATDGREGLLVVAELASGSNLAVINCPVFPLVQGERALTPDALPVLLALAENLPAGKITARDGFVYYKVSFAIESIDKEVIPHTFRRMRNQLQRLKNALLVAYARYFGADQAQIDRMILLPVLPEIPLSDEDAERIHFFLLRADQKARDLFAFLMTRWTELGYIVGTTPTSIVLDAPYGQHHGRVRLAILLSGLSQNMVDYFSGEGYQTEPPAIVLRWASLRGQEGIPAQAFEVYQKNVTDTLTLRLTASSAHVEDVLGLNQESLENLLQAMDALVRRIDHSAIKPKQRSKCVTLSNLRASLDLCDQATRAIFERMITGWKSKEGTVQCTKVGRIYLKMHTKSHKKGELSRLPRRFNLLTLVCPGEGRLPSIQVAWKLADPEHPAAYLDCIPEAVAKFEAVVASLPGFEQQGTITRLVLDENFTGDDLEALMLASFRLKLDEKYAS